MAPKKKTITAPPAELPQPFYELLRKFYVENRSSIRRKYRDLSKKFLDHNDPSLKGWLRAPQFEALEIYVFLKEFCDNQQLAQIFENWAYLQNGFESRAPLKAQYSLLDDIDEDAKEATRAIYENVIAALKAFRQDYPNYIFALTMGLGKTVLMATSIFYEFLLANKWPKDERYCHNALVFAPDKTVLHSLREISTMDKSLVVPPDYVSWLEANLKFHFLDDAGTTLNLLDHSKYNLVISNTQKVILKKKKKDDSAAGSLFKAEANVHQAKSINTEFMDLYDFDETDLATNQRFEKLLRLDQLGIYVDEAHHVFGSNLAKDLGVGSKLATTSLRLTINELAAELKHRNARVVACYNYTGTPYVGTQLLPEVVYAFGLKESIDGSYLKKAAVTSFSHTKSKEFLRIAISEFWTKCGENRTEGMLPKMAIFGTTIEELQAEIRPAVEDILHEHGISHEKILVNVGDEKITTNDDLREFRQLDSPRSAKQFILLVNKGKEGWNCRSLFAVALHREPQSKIFVLQATMRCLRAIGNKQETGLVYLSEDNRKLLEKELEENFRLSIEGLNKSGSTKKTYKVHKLPPPVLVKVKRVHKRHEIREKQIPDHVNLELGNVNLENYQIIRTDTSLDKLGKGTKKNIQSAEQRLFSALTLSAEVARYLNRSPIEVRKILENSQEGMSNVLQLVNQHNEILFDWVIPHLFKDLYEIDEFEKKVEEEIDLVKDPSPDNFYSVHAEEDLVYESSHLSVQTYVHKSFHLDTYAFDSKPEKELFWKFLSSPKIAKVWFTGMLTHGQSDFFINYIDPETHSVRSYFPDFLVQTDSGKMMLIEVKGDHMIEDPVVKAKALAATELAERNGWIYQMIKGSEIMNRSHVFL